MTAVQIIRPRDDLSNVLGASIIELLHRVWPPAVGAAPSNLEATLEGWRMQESAHFVVADENRVFAHAMMFGREVFTSRGPLRVGALAAVCVHPDFRGRGLGADVVRAAFDFLPELSVEASLFQTGVPQFYEKLGSRVVANRFFSGANPENPFWDACQMIYPASFDWPDGPIDLNGAGY
jgi:predicted N-acetyltransferase YhbS